MVLKDPTCHRHSSFSTEHSTQHTARAQLILVLAHKDQISFIFLLFEFFSRKVTGEKVIEALAVPRWEFVLPKLSGCK